MPIISKGKRLLAFSMAVLLLLSCGQQEGYPRQKTITTIAQRSTAVAITDTSSFLKFTSGVRAILEDSHGNTWFGSHEEGVAKWAGDSMVYFTTADGLSHNQVRSIYEDTARVVWFECAVGISTFQNGQLTNQSVLSPADNGSQAPVINTDINIGLNLADNAQIPRDYSKKTKWESGPHDLWFKSEAGHSFNKVEGGPGAYRYDGQKLVFHLFPMKEYSETYYSVSTPFVRGDQAAPS